MGSVYSPGEQGSGLIPSLIVDDAGGAGGGEVDLLNSSVRNGILYLEDPLDGEWTKHFFILTDSKLYYTDELDNFKSNQGEDDDEDENEEINNQVRNNKWFSQ